MKGANTNICTKHTHPHTLNKSLSTIAEHTMNMLCVCVGTCVLRALCS